MGISLKCAHCFFTATRDILVTIYHFHNARDMCSHSPAARVLPVAMPVRDIPIGNRAVTGQHARSGERYESSLERDFFELMMADPAVASVEGQPVQIVYATPQGKQRRYTPDALVMFRPDAVTGIAVAPLLCEVKYRDEYRAKFLELKERFRVARQYARERGWRFRVITDREIRTCRFANLHFLAGFKDRPPVLEHVKAILTVLAERTDATPATVLAALSPDPWRQAELLPTLWCLIAHSRIKVDLSQPLTMNSQISAPNEINV